MYQIGLRLYYLVAWISSGFQSKARLWIQGRKQVFDCLSSQLPSTKKLIWFHAASLGEFEQGKPLIQALRKARPEAFILLSFYSPSGYELRKHYEAADLVCYLPFDFKSHVNRFLELVQPDVAVFIKYEFWPNLLRSLHRRGIKTYLVSARFRPDQLFFKSYAFPF